MKASLTQELEILKAYGGQLIFSSGEIGFSTNRKLENGILLPEITQQYYSIIHGVMISPSESFMILEKFNVRKNICVIGDI